MSGRGEPQRVQRAGSNAQQAASTGLRSTRATARHAEVPDGGTSSVSAFGSLLKTHLYSQRNQTVASFLPLFLVYIYTRSWVSWQTQFDENKFKIHARDKEK